MRQRKLSDDDALALVIGGLKGEVPIGDLCRRYGVSETTYYKLRDRFMAAGTEGLRNMGHTRQIKSLHDRIRDLERALGRKSLEVELLKKTSDLLKK